MTDQPNGTERGVSRRSVLRTAGAGGFGLLGIAGAAERAGATYCPKPPSYWSKNDWPDTDRITDPLSLVDPADERSVAVWKLLLMDAPDDRAAAMARQLLTVRLNFQRRPTEDSDCVDQPLPEYDGRTVREIVVAARAWLEASNWPGPQPDWVVDGVDGGPLYDALGAFNHGQLADLDCCTGLGRDREDDWENPWRQVTDSDGSGTGRDEEDRPSDDDRDAMGPYRRLGADPPDRPARRPAPW